MEQSRRHYQWIWRWHFYAGLIFAPFLLVLAITGAVYLFKAEIEHALYADLYDVTPQSETMPASHMFSAVKEQYPHAVITRYRPADSADRSAEIGITDHDGTAMTVFVDPHTMQIMGTLDDADRIMDKLEKIHGELMAGTVGDRLVELAACWALILIITGAYLWWPRKRERIWGVVLPRFSKGSRTLVRDLHVVPAAWISAGMFFLIMTGLPWSGFWGTQVQNAATNSGEGYPPSIWVGEAPLSSLKTEDVADVGWSAENLPVPQSVQSAYVPLSIDDVIRIINERGTKPGYDLFIPQEATGVYTVSAFPPKAQDEVTMHIDQYTGAVLADYRYEDYGPAGKAIALGITLHKGSQFGMINKLIGLAVCIGMVLVIVSGLLLWRKRKHGAPARPAAGVAKGLWALIIVLGILFPLAGASMLVVWTIDQIAKRVRGGFAA
ncbi:PepSY domain-containing protein [Domibacillus sp. DTU_2020_1001157_1_SI_ALB_TIR_016]|uniref:PepSY-associated TM helix domain-containing protein n=1 Tax=Domibacillus sp. DTU_2020_1001157_1_SI_ALB_TIR_016 TaxID=3077789 RepID=UPI0028E20E46|nr:PepSY domain-containing protein [Domibacillus sp. DTU_2020_1001157_1_SI_ALB_TIR_016]WNS81469.1 PepSY domain-containing protein [Domibacillus sp. DTU_2020_1001157_1_SI_ALB_TIR_016]